MRDVAGVDHERRLDRHRLDLVDGFLQRAERVGIGRLVEADMAVADLQEGHAGGLGGLRRTDQSQRTGHAARNGPEHAGACPGHAFQHAAAADAVCFIVMVVIAHGKSPWALDWAFRDVIGRGAGLFPGLPSQRWMRDDVFVSGRDLVRRYRESSRIIAAPFSAIIAVGVLVLPEVIVGITEASATRKPAMP